MNPDTLVELIRCYGPMTPGEIVRETGATLREVQRALHTLRAVRRTHGILKPALNNRQRGWRIYEKHDPRDR